ncbi:MAG: hypothetical protein AAFZ01_12170 [Pseudomonadota bacterium]
MSNKTVGQPNVSTASVGDVGTVLRAIETDAGTGRAASVLAETAAKRDEAIMCLRLIAGLNPSLREKAEKTITELSKIPFPATDEH